MTYNETISNPYYWMDARPLLWEMPCPFSHGMMILQSDSGKKPLSSWVLRKTWYKLNTTKDVENQWFIYK